MISDRNGPSSLLVGSSAIKTAGWPGNRLRNHDPLALASAELMG